VAAHEFGARPGYAAASEAHEPATTPTGIVSHRDGIADWMLERMVTLSVGETRNRIFR
jgi:hypothetical protein